MIASGYPQQVTYWANTGESLYGAQNAFAAPVLLEGRWEDKQVQAVSQSGVEFVTHAVVFVPQMVTLGGYLALDDQTTSADPTVLPDAYEIKSIVSVPDLRNVVTERRVML